MDLDPKLFPDPDSVLHPRGHECIRRCRASLVEQLQAGVSITALQKLWQESMRDLQSRELGEILPKIPKLYRETDPERMPNPQAYAAVLRWSSLIARTPHSYFGNHRGLICYGPTGSGKTRAIYDLLARETLVENADFYFCAISASELAGFVRDLALANPRRLARILRLLAGRETDEDFAREEDPDVKRFFGLSALFIDDLSQAKFTPRYAEELLAIIEARTADEKAVFVTCQTTGDRLLEKLAGDNPDLRETAEAIIRRLRDFCDPIGFTAPQAGGDAA